METDTMSKRASRRWPLVVAYLIVAMLLAAFVVLVHGSSEFDDVGIERGAPQGLSDVRPYLRSTVT